MSWKWTTRRLVSLSEWIIHLRFLLWVLLVRKWSPLIRFREDIRLTLSRAWTFSWFCFFRCNSLCKRIGILSLLFHKLLRRFESWLRQFRRRYTKGIWPLPRRDLTWLLFITVFLVILIRLLLFLIFLLILLLVLFLVLLLVLLLVFYPFLLLFFLLLYLFRGEWIESVLSFSLFFSVCFILRRAFWFANLLDFFLLLTISLFKCLLFCQVSLTSFFWGFLTYYSHSHLSLFFLIHFLFLLFLSFSYIFEFWHFLAISILSLLHLLIKISSWTINFCTQCLD